MDDYMEDYLFERTYNKVSERKYLILIIYDIIDNKKRTKFAKYLGGYGNRVQKSAFEAILTQKQYDKLVSGIPSRIASEDNVRIYKLNGNGEVLTWGSNMLKSEDIIII